MTSFKKYMTLLIGGGVALLLIMVALFFLFKFRSEYDRVQMDLAGKQRTLTELHRRNPFPSPENVAKVHEDLRAIESYFNDFMASLAAKQVPSDRIERAQFPPMVAETVRQLQSLAQTQQVKTPDLPEYAFPNYMRGFLPQENHLPRLIVQLRTIDTLTRLLFESQISEFISVERQVFDVEQVQSDVSDGVRVRGGRAPGQPAQEEAIVDASDMAGLYTRERYVFNFISSDLALRNVLNALASSSLFVIVKNVEIRNEWAMTGSNPAQRLAQQLVPRTAPTPSAPGATTFGAPAAGQQRDPLSPAMQRHEDRIVAGRERLRVRLVLDVYRFQAAREEPQP